MALIVNNKEITLENGLTIDTFYVRTGTDLSIEGDKLIAYPSMWVSKDAWSNNREQIHLDLQLKIVYDYDRVVEGFDLLTLANTKLKTELEALGFTVVLDL
jgi:hypothetical protein